MRYILLISANSVTSYATGRSGFDNPVVFLNTDQGCQKLCQYFSERSHSVFSVVLDTRDEEHQSETIPFLRGRERTRALDQIMARSDDENLLSACSLNTITTNNIKKLRVTTSQVAGRSDCEHWIVLLHDNAVLIDCICPLSALALRILQKVRDPARLCVLRLRHSEYRILGFIGSSTVISRHLQTSESCTDELLAEIGKTREYLAHFEFGDNVKNQPDSTATAASGSGNSGDTLLIGLVPSDVKQGLEASGVRVIPEHRLIKLFNKNNINMLSAMEMIMSMMIDRKVRSSTRFNGNYDSHLWQRKVRHGLLAGVLCCFGISAVATAAAVKINQNYNVLQARSETQHDRLMAVSVAHQDLNSLQVDAFRQSVSMVRSIEQAMNYSPMHFLTPFAVDLSLYPEVNITSVQWASSIPAELTLPGEHTANAVAPGYEANVGGHLRFANGELVDAVRHFNSFVHQLKKSSRYQAVEVIEAPLGVGGNATTVSRQERAGLATFLITLRVSGNEYGGE